MTPGRPTQRPRLSTAFVFRVRLARLGLPVILSGSSLTGHINFEDWRQSAGFAPRPGAGLKQPPGGRHITGLLNSRTDLRLTRTALAP